MMAWHLAKEEPPSDMSRVCVEEDDAGKQQEQMETPACGDFTAKSADDAILLQGPEGTARGVGRVQGTEKARPEARRSDSSAYLGGIPFTTEPEVVDPEDSALFTEAVSMSDRGSNPTSGCVRQVSGHIFPVRPVSSGICPFNLCKNGIHK
ncbi:hypothetical protein BDV06DRAFT_129438 [Aspergillus oleicola]